MTATRAIETIEQAAPQPADLRWGSGASVRDRLYADASAFSFYQAVRVLSILHPDAKQFPVHGSLPVRFRSRMGFDFPGADIHQLEPTGGNEPPPQMLVNFLGLAGALGPLPTAYTEQLLRHGDKALRDFLDIFNHRIILLVYRVHEMHHPELTPTSPSEGLAANHLYAFFGLGRDPDAAARNRLSIPDRALLDYSGLLAHRPHSALGLQRLLGDYFQLNVTVEEFTGAWLHLSEDQWTRLGKTRGSNQRLNEGAMLGKRVWDQHAGVTIRLGPLDLSTFKSFLPEGAAHRPLRDLARFYLGDEFDIALKLELRDDQIPRASPVAVGPMPDGSERPELGRLAWLRSRKTKNGNGVESIHSPAQADDSADGDL